MKVEQAKRLKDLEKENARLKRLLDRCRTRQSDPEGSCGGKLLTPSRRRACVDKAINKLSVSERRACRVLRQHRSTQWRTPQNRDDEDALTQAIIRLATHFGRYGYKRITALLKAEGMACESQACFSVVWRREGLKVPSRQPKRSRLWGMTVRVSD